MCEGQVSGPVSKKASGGPERKPIGVFVLEDQEIVRRGIRVLLEAEPDIEVIGEASTASSALAQIPALRPGVAVLDVRLPDGDGVSVCREVRSRAPEVACLMLTAFSDEEALLASIMAGAAGYVLKQIRGSDLVGAVRMVASGRSLLDPRAASKAMARLRDEADRRDPLALAGLTARERKILELIGDGLTNRQIGERLSISVKTVKNYVSTLFVKLGMKRRTQAAAYAARTFGGRTFELSQDMRIINRSLEPTELTRDARQRPASSTIGPGCLNEVGKENLDFPLSGLRRVGSVHDVLLYFQRVISADGAHRSANRVGGAGQDAERLDRPWPLHDESHQRPRRDEVDELAEERPDSMFRVVKLGRVPIQRAQVHRHDPQSLALDPGQDIADEPSPHAVGFNQDQGTFSHKCSSSWWPGGPSIRYGRRAVASTKPRRVIVR